MPKTWQVRIPSIMVETDWLADGGWHYYTVVLDGNNAKVYFEGELKNEWNVSGEGDGNVQQGLLTNGKELTYICLGGNQAWDWNDLDTPFNYAKLMVSNKALSQTDIKAIVAAKPAPTITEFLYENDLKEAGSNLTVVGSGSFCRGCSFSSALAYQNVSLALLHVRITSCCPLTCFHILPTLRPSPSVYG